MAIGRQPHVLVVAGSDSSGGAGIVRDIETLAAFDVKASVAITAVTVQTHDGVSAIDAVAPERVADQMRAAFAANAVDAVKIGMLATPQTIGAVAAVLAQHADIPVVLDPVLASTSGHALLGAGNDALAPLIRLATLTTPNLAELDALSSLQNGAAAREKIDHLFSLGARAILVKGGHGIGANSIDTLHLPGFPARQYSKRRLAGTIRGSGCMLASGIAARLATGDDLGTAIEIAKRHVHEAIARQM